MIVTTKLLYNLYLCLVQLIIVISITIIVIQGQLKKKITVEKANKANSYF